MYYPVLPDYTRRAMIRHGITGHYYSNPESLEPDSYMYSFSMAVPEELFLTKDSFKRIPILALSY